MDILMGVGRAGLKPSGRPDLLLVLLPQTCKASFLFTRNHFKSASVLYSQGVFGGRVRALVVNSGNANCGVGKEGLLHAELMAKKVAERLELEEEEVLVFSTGVIGKPLPIGDVLSAIDSACDLLEPLDLKRASEVISTTDSFPKYDFLKRGRLEVFGFAKGAGMIHPNMGTMLSFVFTNAELEEGVIERLHRDVNERTFNSISVDGCMSTNDSFGLISLGLIREELQKVSDAVEEVSLSLAKKIVQDGEGATRLIKVVVKNASLQLKAKMIAQSVALSNLVKTAVFGKDPNWGRIVAAAGSTPFPIDQFKIKLYVGNHLLYDGKTHLKALEGARKYMERAQEVEIILDLMEGKESWTYYSSDLTYEYVKVNAEYST
ncbi:MAG: bifunctional glutamate N-acetyltransferase/amino-acid acetyltransferase ArgJ [Aquificaceae bacterium]|nr:bifunctional glutamate N-acetyltransferase/amino-acid acetyltransferase ArgJ [Aquificaceae bacterium]MCS7196696.1 bifunctional glutamate N-acetyltransferase/amino-acid acetyltransferase ArgJ [Aquificaceae bacterium]MCX7989795.1 bifunctional glutamate N-acetyltransferase/amino-acid acetyltransferase ArgJ [Aquificaceae bacterium]MDW8032608.1 bifunctional glutamate N-acetyltransferase/amino-acid acetyltransferase ArgJ [Aquificaceae bacterium]